MFVGESKHNIDAKGRILVPVKYREELGETFYITLGLGGCLWVFPENEWNKTVEKFNNMPMTQSRDVQRFFFMNADKVSPDSQGRIIINPTLRKHANLEKEVTFAGVNAKLEVWNSKTLEIEKANINEKDIESTMKLLGV